MIKYILVVFLVFSFAIQGSFAQVYEDKLCSNIDFKFDDKSHTQIMEESLKTCIEPIKEQEQGGYKAGLDETSAGRYYNLVQQYANGEDVTQNLDTAICLVYKRYSKCKEKLSEEELADITQMMVDLKKIKDNPDADSSYFNACGYYSKVTLDVNMCASTDNDLARKKIDKKIALLTAKWSDKEKSAFKKLEKIEGKYRGLASEEEDQSGTGAAMVMADEDTKLHQEFVNYFVEFEKGKLPQFSDGQFKDIDKKLNHIYKTIQNTKIADPDDSRNKMKTNIHTAQIAWLKYRDEFVKLGMLKYPSVNANSWKAYLTEKRIARLQEFDGVFGAW